VTIGFIGLGAMGLGMAHNLIEKGYELTVYDVREDAASSLPSHAVSVVQKPAELPDHCSTIVLCLPSSVEVKSVLTGADGLLTAGADLAFGQPADTAIADNSIAGKSVTLIDMSTLLRGEAMEFAGLCEQTVFKYYDCPVSGLPARGRNGTLTLMFGGDADIFSGHNNLLSAMGSKLIHCGPVGSGQMMKAVNNVIYNINIAAISEIIPLAIASGLDTDAVVKTVLSGSSNSFAAGHFLPRVLERQFDGDFPMQSAYKDIQNIQAMMDEARNNSSAFSPDSMSTTKGMVALYERALADGYGQSAKSAMFQVFEQLHDVEVANSSNPSSES